MPVLVKAKNKLSTSERDEIRQKYVKEIKEAAKATSPVTGDPYILYGLGLSVID